MSLLITQDPLATRLAALKEENAILKEGIAQVTDALKMRNRKAVIAKMGPILRKQNYGTADIMAIYKKLSI